MTTTDVQPRPDEQVQQALGEFALVLPPQMTPEYFTRLSVGLLRRNPTLMQAASADIGGLLAALLDCAQLGLTPGDDCAIVPFRDKKAESGWKIEAVPEWRGLIRRITNTGRVTAVVAEAVFANDRFTRNPFGPPTHEFDPFADEADRGRLIGAYAFAVMVDGGFSKVAFVGPREAARAKASSRGSDKAFSPWQTSEPEMWRKTAVRRLEGWVPTSSVDVTAVRDTTTHTPAVAAPVAPVTLPPVAVPAAVTATMDASHLTIPEPPTDEANDDLVNVVDETTGEILDPEDLA